MDKDKINKEGRLLRIKVFKQVFVQCKGALEKRNKTGNCSIKYEFQICIEFILQIKLSIYTCI